MRLDKLLANEGYGTRKEVKKLIKDGLVSINGEIIFKDDFKVDEENDSIIINGEKLNYEKFSYYIMNKPQGYVCANIDNLYPTVFELMPDDYKEGLFTVGRLDQDTEGLLLITNDGLLSHQLLSSKYHVSKKYYFKFEGTLNDKDIKKLEDGLEIDDYITKPAKYEKISNNEGYLTIEEGKYHQVKKMLEKVNCKIIFLKRVSFGPIELKNDLPLGKYKKLEKNEIDELKQICLKKGQ